MVAIALGLVLGWVGAGLLTRLSEYLASGRALLGPPHCPGCGAALRGPNLPLVARSCPACGARAKPPIWLEAAAIGGTAVVVWRLWGTPEIFVGVLVLWLAIASTAIDMRLRIIPNRLLAGAALLGLLAMIPLGAGAFAQGALGTVVLFAVAALLAVVGRGGFGFGDVKYLAVVGLLLGLDAGIVSLLAAVLLGGLYAAMLLATRRAGRKDTFAFAPFIAIGSVAVLMLWHLPPGH